MSFFQLLDYFMGGYANYHKSWIFDWHDILWTLLGGVSFLSLWKFSYKNYRELNA